MERDRHSDSSDGCLDWLESAAAQFPSALSSSRTSMWWWPLLPVLYLPPSWTAPSHLGTSVQGLRHMFVLVLPLTSVIPPGFRNSLGNGL